MNENKCENCQKTFDKCRDDMAFVQTYCQGLEGMKTLLTRKRDEACVRIAELEKELSVTNDIYTDEREERGMYQARCAELEAHAATLTALASQYKADRDSLEETCRMHSARVIELEKQRDKLYSRPDAVDALKQAIEKIGEDLLDSGHNGPSPFITKWGAKRVIEELIASITDTTKPTKPAMAVEEPEARLEVKQTKWVCVEEGRAEAMREAWQKAISNGDNARVIFADGSQES